MTLPLSAREIVRYVPLADRDKPIEEQRAFLLQVPTMLSRAQFRRDVEALGARYPDTAELMTALRAAIPRLVADEQQAELLAVLDRWEETQAADRTPAEVKRMAEIEAVVGHRDPAYSAAFAERNYYLLVTALMAFRRWVAGWENVAVAYKRTGDLVDEQAASRLPDWLVLEVGRECQLLTRPSEDAAKN